MILLLELFYYYLKMNEISVITKTQRKNKSFKEEFIQTMDKNHYILQSFNNIYGSHGLKLKDNIKNQYMHNQRIQNSIPWKMFDIDEINYHCDTHLYDTDYRDANHNAMKSIYKKYYNHNNNILPFGFTDHNMNRMVVFDPLGSTTLGVLNSTILNSTILNSDQILSNYLLNDISKDVKVVYDSYTQTEKDIFNIFVTDMLKLFDSIGFDRKYICLKYDNGRMIFAYAEKDLPDNNEPEYIPLGYLSFHQSYKIEATRKYDPPKEIINIETVFEFDEYKFYKKYREYGTLVCRAIMQYYNNNEFIEILNTHNTEVSDNLILFSRSMVDSDTDRMVEKLLPSEISEISIEPNMVIPHTVNKKIKIKRETYTPYVAEIIIDFDMITYSLLHSCFVIHDNFDRTKALMLNPTISPVTITILPQFNKTDINDYIPKIASIVSSITDRYIIDGSLDDIAGKYINSDEIGAMFAITIDYITCNDGTVAIRNRKDRKHIRLSINDIYEYISNYLI